MSATVNGYDLLSATIREPRIGVWTAEVDVDADKVLDEHVTIEVDGVRWIGTLVRGQLDNGRVHALVLGGAAALGVVLDAKFYLGAGMGVVLKDLMLETGETLSSSVTASVKNYAPDRWTRVQGTGAQVMRVMADELGMAWRVGRDGTVWLGAETWPDVEVDYDETRRAASHGAVTIAPEAPLVAPGMTFQNAHVSLVTTRVTSGGVRQEILFEDDDGDARFGRVGAEWAAIVESIVGTRIDYARMYPATVISQASDGTLEVIADDVKVRGSGITQVPIRHGLPGVTVEVPADVRVLVFFEDGNPRKPAAALWPDGSSVTKMKIACPEIEIDGNLNVTGEVTAKSGSASSVSLTGHKHPSAVGPTSPPIPQT